MFFKKNILSLFLLVIIVTLVYSNHFQNQFHFDDAHTIQNNAYIRNISNIGLFFKDGRTMSTLIQNQSYRPVVTTSLAIDYWLGGGYNLFYFHLSTFIIFLLMGIMLFFLFSRVVKGRETASFAFAVSITATAWYMLHPAIAETINYVIARSDVLSTFFVILAFILYIYSPLCRKTGMYLIPIVIGALAKPPAVMFAALLFIYLLLVEHDSSFVDFFRKKGLALLIIKKTIPAFVCCGLVYIITDKLTPPSWTPGGNSVVSYLITQPYVILHYFVTLFAPTELSADADWKTFSGITDYHVIMGILFITAMLFTAWVTALKPRLRPISFGILWFFITLVPSSSFVPLAEVMNDHRMFFPFIGLVLSATWTFAISTDALLQKIKITRKKALPFAGGITLAVLSIYAWGVYERNEVWHTEESLWYDVTLKSPENGRGLMNYGLTQMGKGDYKKAEIYFNRALALLPYYSYLHINLAVLKEYTGNPKEAEEHYIKALQLDPPLAEPHLYYGKFLLHQESYAAAIKELEIALQIAPSHIDVIHTLLSAYAAAEEWDKLKMLSEKALKLQADDAEALAYQKAAIERKSELDIAAAQIQEAPTPEKYLDLSLRYYQKAQYKRSIDMAEAALKLKPGYAEAFNNVGAAYIALQDYNAAIAPLKEAIKIKPDFELAKNNLVVATANANVGKSPEQLIDQSLIWFNQGDFKQCIAVCRQILKIKPGYDLAYNNMCAAYNQLQDWDNAIAAGEKGLKYNPNNQLLKNNLQVARKAKLSKHQ